METRYGYMCKVDFDHELGCALGGNVIYPDVDDLKEHRKCVKSCGIVKVRIELEEVVQKELPLSEHKGYKEYMEKKNEKMD